MGLMGFGMTCMYADPWSYGSDDANFGTWDLFFPFGIAGYIYYHRHGHYMKSNKAPIFTSDNNKNFVARAATPLQIKEVVRGTLDDTKFEKDIVTVVLFWASWCASSKKCFAGLDRLQKKYESKGVKWVALSQDPEKDVKNTLRNMKVDCKFCFATENGENTKNYMIEYNINNIPHSFVVGKDGNVVWHGHPTALDRVLHVNTEPKMEQEGSDGDWEKVSEASEEGDKEE